MPNTKYKYPMPKPKDLGKQQQEDVPTHILVPPKSKLDTLIDAYKASPVKPYKRGKEFGITYKIKF
mgnify:CR=1 FL=1